MRHSLFRSTKSAATAHCISITQPADTTAATLTVPCLSSEWAPPPPPTGGDATPGLSAPRACLLRDQAAGRRRDGGARGVNRHAPVQPPPATVLEPLVLGVWVAPVPTRRGEGACGRPLASSGDRDATALADVCSTHNVRHHPRSRPRARAPHRLVHHPPFLAISATPATHLSPPSTPHLPRTLGVPRSLGERHRWSTSSTVNASALPPPTALEVLFFFFPWALYVGTSTLLLLTFPPSRLALPPP